MKLSFRPFFFDKYLYICTNQNEYTKMEFVNETLPENRVAAVGRPRLYPFHELSPGSALKIPIDDSRKKIDWLRKINSALWHYKKSSGVNWQTASRISGDCIKVYRLK